MAISLTHVTDYLLAQSWQIAVFVLLVAVINYLLRNKSAHIRYLLWLIVLAKCFVPPFYDVPLAILPVQEQAEPVVISPLVEMALPETQVADTTMPESSGLHSTPPEITPIPVVEGTYLNLTINQWLGIGWLVGACAFLVFNLLRALRANFWLWRHRKALPVELRSSIEKSFLVSGIKNFPNVWIIEGFSQPFVWGLLRGSIYVPTNFLNINKQEHQKSVLSHELSHVLRFDAAVNIIQVLAQSIFWFHPLIWWINRKIRQEREKCCDEMAIAQMETLPRDYSTAILETIEARNESIHQVPSLAVAGPVKNIEERIKTMLRPGKKFYKRPSVIAIVVLLLVAAFTIPIGCVLTNRNKTITPTTNTKNKESLNESLQEAINIGNIEEVKKLISQGADVNAQDEGGMTFLISVMQGLTSLDREIAELLIEAGADVDSQDIYGMTALHNAIIVGLYTDLVSLLVDRGADVNLTDDQGSTPLHYAVDMLNFENVRVLVDKGADFNIKNSQGETAFSLAALYGRTDMTDLFLSKGADATSLYMAAFTGDLPRVRELVEAGIDVDVKDEFGWTALFWATCSGQAEIAEFLIENNADLNVRGGRENSLLHQASQARTDSTKLVNLLIEKGADINVKNGRGRTPLHLACYSGNKNVAELLIDNGADVNSVPTPLHMAANTNHTDVAELLISKGADINAEENNQVTRYTPLHMAAMNNIDMVKCLVDNGADIEASSGGFGRTAFHQAVIFGKTDVVKYLAEKGADINASDNYPGITPLAWAVRQGWTEIVELLIAQGADVNTSDRTGYTPLDMAEERGNVKIISILRSHGGTLSLIGAVKSINIEQVKVLIAEEINPNTKNTALLEACSIGELDIIKLLVDNGSDVNTKNAAGNTPMHFASQYGHKNVIEFLISKGADINIENISNQTPLDLADQNRQKEVSEFLINNGAKKATPNLLMAVTSENVEQVKLLISQGADVNAQQANPTGNTLLHTACESGNKEIAELLIDNGAEVNAKNRIPGQTPLHQACENGNKEIVEFLTDKGADVNLQNNYGRTPLYIAIREGHMDVVVLLLDKGANANISLNNMSVRIGGRGRGGRGGGMALLDWAEQNDQTEIIDLLREHGAEE